MKFTVDTWAPEYGVAADAAQLDEATDDVDVGVERPADEWTPIDPTDVTIPDCIVFVDGVRRIDARVWIADGDLVRAGVCASVTAGAVRCEAGTAKVIGPVVFRGMYAAASDQAGPIVTRHGTYEFVPCVGDAPDDLYRGIHDRMTDLELTLAEGDDADLLVFDGPLRGRGENNAVGFIKTQHVQYLPDDQQRVLGQLDAGQRTPLFRIGGRFTRWSWYVRLPAPIRQPLSGIVRCELPGAGTAKGAAARADQVTAALPRFASEPHKDARAPQNLYPIAGLENDLRRRLGDQGVLDRGLRIASGGGA